MLEQCYSDGENHCSDAEVWGAGQLSLVIITARLTARREKRRQDWRQMVSEMAS